MTRRLPRLSDGALEYLHARSATDSRGCRVWGRARNPAGYGVINTGPRTALAHRISYEAHKGPIPPGKVVRHTCDNPSCVNPEHLIVGDPADNSADAKSRDRIAHGTLHWRSVLDERDVQEIRKRVTLGEVQAEVARLFGVSSSVVSEISTGKAWERA